MPAKRVVGPVKHMVLRPIGNLGHDQWVQISCASALAPQRTPSLFEQLRELVDIFLQVLGSREIEEPSGR